LITSRDIAAVKEKFEPHHAITEVPVVGAVQIALAIFVPVGEILPLVSGDPFFSSRHVILAEGQPPL
jgi:hypothetical protein